MNSNESVYLEIYPTKTKAMENKDKESKYIKAKERVEELKKFYAHLGSYVLVISVLALINYLTNGFNYMWFLCICNFYACLGACHSDSFIYVLLLLSVDVWC